MFKINLNKEDIKQSVVVTDLELLQKPDFLCLHGSKLYGTETKDSDTDIRGFVFLPAEYILGVKIFEQHESIYTDTDTVIWSVNKLVGMLIRGISTATEMMFCPEKYIILKSDLASEIVRNRSIFISKTTIENHLGYATSEWRKVKGETTRKLGERRKDDMEKYGYSVRNAYHTIRLLNQAKDLLEYREIFYPLPNCEYLKAIKGGDVPFKEVEKSYDYLMNWVERSLNIISDSCLPSKPDYGRINKLLCQLNLRHILYNLIPTKSYDLPFYYHSST